MHQHCMLDRFAFFMWQIMVYNALLCVGKEVPRNPPALHAGPLRFLPRRKKLGKKGFAIWSLRGVRATSQY